MPATYQSVLAPNTLYEIMANDLTKANQAKVALEVIGGTVNVFGSFKKPDAAPTNMAQTATGFTGIDELNILPNYIYIQGSPTSIIINGVTAKQVV